MSEELFERFRRDNDARAYEHLIEAHRPLVRSVCARFLRDPNDVDDAMQETFLKLAGAAGLIKQGSSVPAWLAATAHTTSIDLIRRSVRERTRRRGLAEASGREPAHGGRWRRSIDDAIRSHLCDALNVMEAAQRELLLSRYIAHAPLRDIAAQLHVSVPTASRRVAAAVAQLAEVLRGMGVRDADGQAIVQHFADPFNTESDAIESQAVRFAPDWSCPQLAPLGTAALKPFGKGWTRPLRFGVVVSYQTTITLGAHGFFGGMYEQVRTSLYVPTAGVQLVGVVEPATIHCGIVERTLREYRLLGGLVEADDVEGLGTLDVLLIGNNFALSDSIVRAVNRGMRGGMGLLNEYWTSRSEGSVIMPELQELMLADCPYFGYHTRPCGQPRPVCVLREHPLLPGLKVGRRMMLNGCGPAYRPVRGAQMLLAKEMRIGPQEHGMGYETGALPMPGYLLGQLGRGRIAAVHAWPHEVFTRQLAIDKQQYFVNLLRWLASPRTG